MSQNHFFKKVVVISVFYWFNHNKSFCLIILLDTGGKSQLTYGNTVELSSGCLYNLFLFAGNY